MPTPELPLEGSCLCGAVRVVLTALPLLSVACHCSDCQKFTASAFSLTTMFPRKSFTCSGSLVTGGLGTAERTHHFCASCKNFIYSEITAAPDRINLRTSVLDDAAAFPPFVEILAGEKLPWAIAPVQHSYARCPETPEALHSLMQAYERTLR